jgi:hypothetical protein
MDGQGDARRHERWLARVVLLEDAPRRAGRPGALVRFVAIADEQLAVELAALAVFAREPALARANLDWAPRPLTLVLDDGRRLRGCRLGVPPRVGRLDAPLERRVGALVVPLYHPELGAPARSPHRPGRGRRAEPLAVPGALVAASGEAR